MTDSVPVPLHDILALAAEAERANRLDVAGRLADYILRAYPNQAEALHLGGIVAYRQGREADALAMLEQAIAHGIDTPLYLRNICEVYRKLGRLDDALTAGRRAVALAPEDPISLHNLAVVHYERQEVTDSVACARQALSINSALPGPHFALAEALLLRGDMAAGWDEYEWRFRLQGVPPLVPATDKPQWDGTGFQDATLLLVADQGFGDIIQFARYIPWAAERCPDFVVACPPPVAPLLRQIHPAIRLIHDWAACPPYRAYAALSGLPRLHGTRLDTVPAPVPYLHADQARAALWRERLSGVVPAGFRRIGIVWAGRPSHANDHRRSASLRAFSALGTLPGTALIALQKGPSTGQAGGYFGRAPLVNVGAEIGDYDDTMAILDCLDLLVTVDTSVAHLAAAMGRPVWILLPTAPDWRWLLDREDSPWYPTVRLFRQSEPRRWDDVIDRVTAALRQRFAA